MAPSPPASVLILDHGGGHIVITAAAQMETLHQIFQIFLVLSCGQLEKQLTDFFFVGHGSNRGFYPGNILVDEEIRFRAQISHDYLLLYLIL